MSVLPYCGEIAETYTQGPSKTVFNTECNIIPDFVADVEDHTKMYKPEVDLTLTCRTAEGEAVLDNTYVSTYVHETDVWRYSHTLQQLVQDSIQLLRPRGANRIRW